MNEECYSKQAVQVAHAASGLFRREVVAQIGDDAPPDGRGQIAAELASQAPGVTASLSVGELTEVGNVVGQA